MIRERRGEERSYGADVRERNEVCVRVKRKIER